MSWIFKNRKGEEIRISDEKVEEARMKIPSISNTIDIPKLDDYSYYYKDRYEES